MKLNRRCGMSLILLCAALCVSVPPAAAQTSTTLHREPAAQTAPITTPQAKSKAEFDAYQAAAALGDPATLETAARNFAQRYASSELRPYLFQRAMGLYQQANDAPKTLEMARDVLKYDPANPVALLTAAQILAENTRDEDLDHEERLQEARTDALAALQHAGELMRPASLSHEQFASAASQLRADAHEVLATVAYKQRDYRQAVSEYNSAIGLQSGSAEAPVWLRLAVAYDKIGEFTPAIAAAEKAIAAAQPGTPARALAEKERARLMALTTATSNSAPALPAPVQGE